MTIPIDHRTPETRTPNGKTFRFAVCRAVRPPRRGGNDRAAAVTGRARTRLCVRRRREPTAVARAARVAPEAHEPARRLLKNPAASRATKTRAWRDVADARLETLATSRRAKASSR